MKASEFIARAKAVSMLPTQYLMGGFGCRLGLDWYNADYTWNKNNRAKIDSKKKTNPLTFGFDCVCLVKGILWGFSGDPKKEYGGSVYQSNKVPDWSISQIKENTCSGFSTNFDDIEEGELVFIGNSHVGIYIGNGEVIESTPAWKCCVQRTLLPSRNSSNYEKLPVRKWDNHAHTSFIEYPKATDWKTEYYEAVKRYQTAEDKLKKIGDILTNA